MTTISDTTSLAQLPQFSVVQFRGGALGEAKRLVWQLDEVWFAPGSIAPFVISPASGTVVARNYR